MTSHKLLYLSIALALQGLTQSVEASAKSSPSDVTRLKLADPSTIASSDAFTHLANIPTSSSFALQKYSGKRLAMRALTPAELLLIAAASSYTSGPPSDDPPPSTSFPPSSVPPSSSCS